jgi:Protein of unknown function (DUF4065)
MTFDGEKFKNLIHYVIWKTSGKDGFGATKLYKVLWFAESRAYVTRRQPIANAVYIRRKHGPVPEVGMLARNELERDGLISQKKVNRGKFEEWTFRCLRPPLTGLLSELEKMDVDYWIRHIDLDHTAKSISDLSHDYGWEIAKMDEVLPLHAVLSERFREPTDKELESAKKRAIAAGHMIAGF